jgi:hypothetical protein
MNRARPWLFYADLWNWLPLSPKRDYRSCNTIAAFVLGLQAGERQSLLGITWRFAVLFLSTGLSGLLIFRKIH